MGEISILIAVGAGHRDEAFKICRYILEEVKHQSPIWKKEHYTGGKEEWLPGSFIKTSRKNKMSIEKGQCKFGYLDCFNSWNILVFWSLNSALHRRCTSSSLAISFF